MTQAEFQTVVLERFTTLEQGVAGGFQHLNARMTGLEARVGGIEGRIASLETRITGLETTVNAARQESRDREAIGFQPA